MNQLAYRLADAVQYPWHKFAESRIGRAVIWFCTVGIVFFARVTWLWIVLICNWVRVGVIAMIPVLKVMLKVMKWAFITSFIIGVGVLFVFLRFCTGRSKMGKVRA